MTKNRKKLLIVATALLGVCLAGGIILPLFMQRKYRDHEFDLVQSNPANAFLLVEMLEDRDVFSQKSLDAWYADISELIPNE